MNIVGCDLSINGSGFTVLECNDNLDITNVFFLGFTKIKKLVRHLDNLHIELLPKNYSEYPYHYRGDIIFDIFAKYYNPGNLDFMVVEDYSFGSKGNTFDIAEVIGGIKNRFYELRIPYKKYSPSTIKLFATGKGSADKVFMGLAFEQLKNGLIDDSVALHSYESPKADLVDSFWAAQLYRHELLYVKHGEPYSDILKPYGEKSIAALIGGNKKVKTAPAMEHETILYHNEYLN